MVASAVVGYFAVAVLLRMIVSMRLVPFIVYTAVLGLFLVVRAPAMPSPEAPPLPATVQGR
jgi:undecaprenyl pyrophosphate phosphatase UppP